MRTLREVKKTRRGIAMSKSFKQSIKKSAKGRWVLHPFDATPVWVPARRSR
jgi:hypothetical protein